MIDFTTGKVVQKKFWFCFDHQDDTFWVYGVDGSCWFVGAAPEGEGA